MKKLSEEGNKILKRKRDKWKIQAERKIIIESMFLILMNKKASFLHV